MLEARSGMVRRQEVEALLDSRVVSHEVQMRHLQEKLSAMADREEVLRLIDAKPDWEGLKVGLRAMVAGEMRVGVPDVVRAVSDEAVSQIRDEMESHLEEVEARMHATVRRATASLQSQLERQASEHRLEMDNMRLALEEAQHEVAEQRLGTAVGETLPPGNPPDDGKQLEGTGPATGDESSEVADATTQEEGGNAAGPQGAAPEGKEQQGAQPDAKSPPVPPVTVRGAEGGGGDAPEPPSSPAASEASVASRRSRPSASSAARSRPGSRQDHSLPPSRQPPAASAAVVEKALARMQQLDHRLSKLEVATLGGGSVGPALESDDDEDESEAKVERGRSRPASRAASRRSRLSRGALVSRRGRGQDASPDAASQPGWDLDASMTASGAFKYLVDGMKALQRVTAEATGKVRELEAEMARRSDSINTRISAAMDEALTTGISDARNHVAEAVKIAEVEMERDRERQGEVMEAKLAAVRDEMEYRVGDLSQHVDNLSQRTDNVVRRAIESQGDELVAGMRKQTARLSSTVDYHVQQIGERLADVERRTMEEIGELAQHVAKAEAEAQGAVTEAAEAAEKATSCEQTLTQLRDELRAVSGNGMDNAIDTMREAFSRYDNDISELKRDTQALQQGKAEVDAVERLKTKADEVDVDIKSQLAMIQRLESALTLQDQVVSLRGSVTSMAKRMDGLEGDARTRAGSQEAMNRSVALQLEKYLAALRHEVSRREVAESQVQSMGKAVDDVKSRVESFKYEVAALRDAAVQGQDSARGSADGGEGKRPGQSPAGGGDASTGAPWKKVRSHVRRRASSAMDGPARGVRFAQAVETLSPITASRGPRPSPSAQDAAQQPARPARSQDAGPSVKAPTGPETGDGQAAAEAVEAARAAVAISKRVKGALSGFEARLESVRSTVDRVAEEAKSEARGEAAALRADFAVLQSQVRALETAWKVEQQALTGELDRQQRTQRTLVKELMNRWDNEREGELARETGRPRSGSRHGSRKGGRRTTRGGGSGSMSVLTHASGRGSTLMLEHSASSPVLPNVRSKQQRKGK